jgi:1-acyl-sn-glycerol-3-phosphate acyltransferase
MMSLVKKVLFALARTWFALTFALTVLWTSLLTRLTHMLFFISKRSRERISTQIAGLGFRAIFALNPQISIEHVGDDEPAWDDLFAQEGSTPFVLINHTSQLDSLFYSACIPTAHIVNLRTMAKSSLFNIPVFGWLLQACGHFPVFFAKETALNDFSVDKQAQEKVQKQVEEYIDRGGGLSLFPEGQINRSNSRNLQSFRRGSLQLARNKNMTLWGFLHTGIDQIWPHNEPMGGYPGRIRFKLFKIPTKPKDTDIAEYVQHIEKIMQLELDLMHALDEGKSVEEIQLAKDALLDEVKVTAHGDKALEKELSKPVDMQGR